MPDAQIHLTDAEFAVLEQLWKEGPETIRDLTSRLYPQGTDSDYSTVQKLLDRLEKKQCVSRNRSSMAHIFEAIVSRNDIIGSHLREVADKLCEGSMTPMLMHLVETTRLTKRERETVLDLLKKSGRGRKGK